MYQTIFIDTWPWWAGGIAIGLFVFLFFIVTGKTLGVSTGYVNLCQLALPVKKLSFFQSPAYGESSRWRLFFIIGMVGGGFISALAAHTAGFSLDKGFQAMAPVFPGPVKYLVLFLGGLFLGFGARLAGGCTSGHGIVGMAQMALPSVISTIFFMISGIILANLIFRVIGGGVLP